MRTTFMSAGVGWSSGIGPSSRPTAWSNWSVVSTAPLAWAEEGQQVAAIFKGIGAALTEIRFGPHTYRPDEPSTAAGRPTVSFGDAIRVTVSRDVHWLQPTFETATYRFLGSASDELQQQFRADLQAVLRFFAEEYGIQPDFSRYTILVPTDKYVLEADRVGTRDYLPDMSQATGCGLGEQWQCGRRQTRVMAELV